MFQYPKILLGESPMRHMPSPSEKIFRTFGSVFKGIPKQRFQIHRDKPRQIPPQGFDDTAHHSCFVLRTGQMLVGIPTTDTDSAGPGCGSGCLLVLVLVILAGIYLAITVPPDAWIMLLMIVGMLFGAAG